MELNFSKTDLGRLVRGDWELVCGRWKKDGADTEGQWLTIKEDGLYLSKKEIQKQPWVHPGREGLVLPLPTFTLAQFRAFCEWHPTFEWEAITSMFTNDDGTIDGDALNELASRGEAAAALVCGVLHPVDDGYLRAWQAHCEVDDVEREIRELEMVKPVGVTEILERKKALSDLRAERARLMAQIEGKEPPEPALMEPVPAQQAHTQAAAPAPVADESESNAPLQKAKAKRRTWKDVSASYIVEVMRAGRYTTAKELYRALESKAGANSPFDKGTGDNRGSLFVRDIAESLSLKTVQNNWQSLREQAKK